VCAGQLGIFHLTGQAMQVQHRLAHVDAIALAAVYYRAVLPVAVVNVDDEGRGGAQGQLFAHAHQLPQALVFLLQDIQLQQSARYCP